MKDWTLIAKASGLNIPAQELSRLVPTLNALDDAFRPLVSALTPDMEPAGHFAAGEENL
jgi:hypothetical protein